MVKKPVEFRAELAPVRWMLRMFAGRLISAERIAARVSTPRKVTKNACQESCFQSEHIPGLELMLSDMCVAVSTRDIILWIESIEKFLESEVLRETSPNFEESDVRHFNVARFLLAGSDLPIALEAEREAESEPREAE